MNPLVRTPLDIKLHRIRKTELNDLRPSDSKKFTTTLKARQQRKRVPQTSREDWPTAERARGRPGAHYEDGEAATHRDRVSGIHAPRAGRRRIHKQENVDVQAFLTPRPVSTGRGCGPRRGIHSMLPPLPSLQGDAPHDGVWVPKPPSGDDTAAFGAFARQHRPRPEETHQHFYDTQGSLPPQTSRNLKPMGSWGCRSGHQVHSLLEQADDEGRSHEGTELGGRGYDGRLGYLAYQGPLASLLPQEVPTHQCPPDPYYLDHLPVMPQEEAEMLMGQRVDEQDYTASSMQTEQAAAPEIDFSVSGRPLVNHSQKVTRPIYLWSFIDSLYPVNAAEDSAGPIYMQQPPTYGPLPVRSTRQHVRTTKPAPIGPELSVKGNYDGAGPSIDLSELSADAFVSTEVRLTRDT